MRAAIMQPYFFPYIGYWQLFFNCDVWVFFDSVQYNKKSWMNRNRILHPDAVKDYQYINVPIRKHAKGTLIKDISINNDEEWAKKLLGQLTVYKKLKAPYYSDVFDLVSEITGSRHESFVSLVIYTAKIICDYLGKRVESKLSSDLDFDTSLIREADDWALVISEALGADEYINPPGGVDIFNVEKYKDRGIDIMFLKSNLTEYTQAHRKFIPGLSIIDVLMFNSKETVSEMIKNDYKLLTKSGLST